MAEKRMCPHCGSQMFMAKITRAGLVEFTTDPNEPSKILKENKDKFDIEIVGCARCKANVVESDLITSVKCKECGRTVSPMDINEEGICNVCDAVKKRTEIANASREDLIKMLLDAEKKVNPVAAKMEKQIDKAEEVAAPVDDVTEEAPTDSVDDTTDETTEKKKPTRRATRRKKDEVAEEVSTETVDAAPSEVAEDSLTMSIENELNNIANQQEAPFPDVAMNLPEETPQVAEETPVTVATEQVEQEEAIGADFKMFDDGEEAF